MKTFLREQRGAAYLETLIALPIMFALFNALVLCGYLCTAKLIVQRAASAAARAAVVFLPDDPEYYDRNDAKSGRKSASKEACVKQAARHVLMASPFFLVDDANLDVKIEGAKKHFSATKVTVRAKYDCSSFLGAFLCRLVSGQADVVPLSAASTLASQEGFVEK